MKLAFSNIAWSPHDRPEILQLLRDQGIEGIEIAPTKIWPEWEGATVREAELYATWLRGEGFDVPALQAVLFGRPEARLFDDKGEAALLCHLARVAEIAEAFGAGVVVLGAPKQRDRGSLSDKEAFERAIRVLRRAADSFVAHGTCLCIEPNPRRYGCNFVVNAREGGELVRHVGHAGFGLHLDAAAMFLENDDLPQLWPDVAPLVRHFHISEPDLGDFATPQVQHSANLAFLDSAGYEGWCSVEMREPSSPLETVGPWSILKVAHG